MLFQRALRNEDAVKTDPKADIQINIYEPPFLCLYQKISSWNYCWDRDMWSEGQF